MPLARLNGININYRVEGQGEPLVMIMGFSGRRSGWIRQIPFFRKHYRVITLDNRSRQVEQATRPLFHENDGRRYNRADGPARD
jgi:pimeloyl-ACP methyl ester carboxylesterase